MGSYHFSEHLKTKKRSYIRKRKYNSKYNGGLTYREAKKQTVILLALLIGFIYTGIFQYITVTSNSIHINGDEVEASTQVETTRAVLVEMNPSTEPVGEIREITAYNAGDPNQTDSTPCISASGDNICNLLAQGKKICAANFVPIGTILEIEGLGACEVLDRMASRYPQNVDWAMEAHQKQGAIGFGVKRLKVLIRLNQAK